MFYYIAGSLAHKGENFAVVDASGVGYKIYTSQSSLERMGAVGEAIKMHTHLYVREDIFDLYGFSSSEEMSMFLLLISVSGIGPKAALSLLSVMTPAQLALAIVTGDAKSITRAQGIGPKVAGRVVLELKDKIKNADMVSADVAASGVSYSSGSTSEALEALVVLGYSPNEARTALSGIDTNQDLELIIKQALMQLMK